MSHVPTAEPPCHGLAPRVSSGCHECRAGTCPCAVARARHCRVALLIPGGSVPVLQQLGRLFLTLDFWDLIIVKSGPLYMVKLPGK